MRNTRNIILGFLIASAAVPSVALAARTSIDWVNLSGTTYIQPNYPSGVDLLILGSNRYINFNTITGSSGYGFRDSAGVMQFKNSGGAWTAFGSGSGGGSGSVGTSTADVANQVTFFTSNSATPALVGGSAAFTWDGTELNLGVDSSKNAIQRFLSGSGGNWDWIDNTNGGDLRFSYGASVGAHPLMTLAGGNSVNTVTFFNVSGFGAIFQPVVLTANRTFNLPDKTGTTTLLDSRGLGLFQVDNASTSVFSNFGTAYFGGSATTTIDSSGNVTLPAAATFSGANLSSCSGAGNALTWVSATKLFGCASGYLTSAVTSVSGTTNQITSSGGNTPTLSLPNLVIFPSAASSTLLSVFNTFYAGGTATTTINSLGNLSTNQATTTSFYNTGLTSALALFDANHRETAYAGSSNPCSANQAPTTLSAVGALGGCTSTFQLSGTYITALGNYATTTGTAISLSTTTATVNGLTYGMTIAVSANGIVWTPTVTGTYNGQAGSVANALTMNNGGAGAASGSTYNGSSATTISYNSIGAAPSTRNLTVAGTTNQITSSAGAQDLSADRTWTLSLPNLVIFPNLASTTQLSVFNTFYAGGTATTSINSLGNLSTNQATTTSFYNTGLTSALALFDANHKETAYGGSANCTNQVVNGISAVGAGNCVSITDAMFSGQLSLAHGGTNAALSGANQVTYINSGNTAQTNDALFQRFVAQGALLMGTSTTQQGLLTIGTSTTWQLGLFDNAVADNGWTFRNEGGAFAISTTTGSATSTTDVVNFNLASYLWQFFSNVLVKITSTTAFRVQDGFGTSILTVNTASTSGAIFQVQATSSTDTLFQVDQYGHLTASSTKATPTVSCSPSGGTIAANSNDTTGDITSGTNSTSCTVTFGAAFSATPEVLITDSNTTAVTDVSARSTTAFTVSFASALSAVNVSYFVIIP
jgi:hypothetical protein